LIVDPFLEIGVLTRPHGLAGMLRVKLFAVDADVLAPGRSLRLVLPDGVDLDREILRVQPGSKGLPVVQLQGCADRSAAKRLQGARVLVRRDDLPPLQGDEFYLVDAVGCAVSVVGQGELGRVVEIGDNGAQALLLIQHGAVLYNVPAVPEFIAGFDGEQLLLELPDGLLDAVAEPVGEKS
jgi:16S rRNA processing protein RimM